MAEWTGQLEQDNRTGQPGQNNRDRTARSGSGTGSDAQQKSSRTFKIVNKA
jgi:hypothetical protein